MATKILPVRNSERSCFKDCRQKWKWAYVDCLSTKAPKSALAFGSLWHDTMEYFYKPGRKRGKNPVDFLVKHYRQHLEDGGPEIIISQGRGEEAVTAEELGAEMMKNYLEEYGQDERFEVISPEQTFQVDVFDDDTGRYLFTSVGTFDVVVRDMEIGKIGFMEHKTGASLDPFGAPLALDEQAGSYWAYGPDWLRHTGALKKGEDVEFILYNRARKAFKDTRPRNELGQSLNKPTKDALVEECVRRELLESGTVAALTQRLLEDGCDVEQLGEPSKIQPMGLFKREYCYRSATDRKHQMERAKLEVREMKLCRAGKLGIYKNPGKHCGFCEFRDMCEVHETGSDWELLRDLGFEKWEPYGDHQENLTEEEEH